MEILLSLDGLGLVDAQARQLAISTFTGNQLEPA